MNAGLGELAGQDAEVFIKPITIRLVAYGQKANIAAIRTRVVALLQDEHQRVDEALLADMTAAEVHAEILARRQDTEAELKKPTASQAGIAITLPDMNERATTAWLNELPVAKSCIAFASWTSHREGLACQLLIADGDRWSANRPLKS